MKRLKLIVFGLVCVVIGATLVLPAQANYVSSRDAHTFMGYHLRSFALVSWVKQQVFRKTQSDARYINARSNDTMTKTLRVKDIRYYDGITSYLTVPAAAFRPATSGQTYSGSSNGGSVYSNGKMIAAVNLPQDAKITGIGHYFYDTDSSSDSTVTLKKLDIYANDGLDQSIKALSSSGSSGYSFEGSSISATVDNVLNEYFLLLENTAANKQLVAVRIIYKITKPY